MTKKIWNLSSMMAHAFDSEDNKCEVRIGKGKPEMHLRCTNEANDSFGHFLFYFDGLRVSISEAGLMLNNQKALVPSKKVMRKAAEKDLKAGIKAAKKEIKAEKKAKKKATKAKTTHEERLNADPETPPALVKPENKNKKK